MLTEIQDYVAARQKPRPKQDPHTHAPTFPVECQPWRRPLRQWGEYMQVPFLRVALSTKDS